VFGNHLIAAEDKQAIELMLIRNQKIVDLRKTCLALAQGYNDPQSFFRIAGVPKDIINLIAQHSATVCGM
jgi:hypothetical protein